MATHISTKLRALREAAGLSQGDLAERAKLSRRTLEGYEQGRYEPAWDAVFRLAGALGVSMDTFVECVGVRLRSQDRRGRGRPKKAPA